ncbi:MAG: hypothetical protein WDZ53_09525, partial [Balneolales bacterium]
TNHLDIQSKNVLLQALKDYKGTVLAVSHDRHFLAEFASTVWRVEDGQVSIYDGGYSYYEWKRREQTAAPAYNGNRPESPPVKTTQTRKDGGGPKTKEQKRLEAQMRKKPGGRSNGNPNGFKKQIHQYELELEQLEARKAELEKLLADTSFYDKPEATGCIREHAEIEKKSTELFSKWTEAAEKLEAMEK